MRKAQSPRSASHRAHTDDKNDREFRDLIDSFAATDGELTAIIDLPDLSVQEVKDYLPMNKQTNRSKAKVAAALRTAQRRFGRGWRKIAKEFAASAIVLDHQSPNPRKT